MVWVVWADNRRPCPGQGWPQCIVRISFGEGQLLLILSTLFNTICLKTNISSLFRCLKKTLEILCITNCYLLQSDLDYLPYCLNILELKCLDFSNIPLSHLFLEHLRFLFERVRHTLECPILKSCEMGESQFNSLLPAISQCCQLTEVNFYDNELSLIFLKKFLHHTAKLSQLTYELYPAPLECYDNRDIILSHRLENFCPELLNILRAKKTAQGGHLCYNPML